MSTSNWACRPADIIGTIIPAPYHYIQTIETHFKSKVPPTNEFRTMYIRWHMLIVVVFIASCCVCKCSGACLRQINNIQSINSLMDCNILHVFSATYLFDFNEQTVLCMDRSVHVFSQWETMLHRDVVSHWLDAYHCIWRHGSLSTLV